MQFKTILLTIYCLYLCSIKTYTSQFEELPLDLKIRISRYFHEDDILNLAHTCKRMHNICKYICSEKQFRLKNSDILRENIKAGISHDSLFSKLLFRGYNLDRNETKILLSNTNLTDLTIKNCQLKEYFFRKLLDYSYINLNIKLIKLEDVDIQRRDSEYLAKYITKNVNINTLYLINNTSKNRNISSIINSLNFSYITTLDFTNNLIDDKSCQIMSKVLEKNHTIKILIMKINLIGDEGIKSLGKSLLANRHLIYLDISNNKFYKNSIFYFVQALTSKDAVLEVLKISINKINDLDAMYLSSILKINKSLEEVNLSYNLIGNVGAEYISYSLKENNTLKKLNLKNNIIQDKGIEYLCEVMRYNDTITELNLL